MKGFSRVLSYREHLCISFFQPGYIRSLILSHSCLTNWRTGFQFTQVGSGGGFVCNSLSSLQVTGGSLIFTWNTKSSLAPKNQLKPDSSLDLDWLIIKTKRVF